MKFNRINRFSATATIPVFFYLNLVIVPLFSDNNLHGQEMNSKVKNSSFLNSFWFMLAAQDTNKQKIIFIQRSPLKSQRIELLSSNKFKHLGETNFTGKKGFNLKMSMGNNFESISLVDKAYRKKSLGMPLIIAGGAASFIGIVLLEMYHQDSQFSTKPNASFLWSGISLSISGLVSMIIGFQNNGSLPRDLKKAVSVYNNSITQDEPEKNQENQNVTNKD